VAKSPKSISGVLTDISGPIIFAKISISNEIPSSNWNTILDLNFPSLSGVNLILKTTSSPNDIFNLSFTFNICSSSSFPFSIIFIISLDFVPFVAFNFEFVFLLLFVLVLLLNPVLVFESFDKGLSFPLILDFVLFFFSLLFSFFFF